MPKNSKQLACSTDNCSAPPDLLAGFGGLLLRRAKGKGEGGEGRKGKGRGGEERGRKGRRGKGRGGEGKGHEPPHYLEEVYAYVSDQLA